MIPSAAATTRPGVLICSSRSCAPSTEGSILPAQALQHLRRSAGSGLSNASRSPVAGMREREPRRVQGGPLERRQQLARAGPRARAACACRRTSRRRPRDGRCDARCTRIWCVRPVWMRTRSSAAPSSVSTTVYDVSAARPPRARTDMRLRWTGSRPMGALDRPCARRGHAEHDGQRTPSPPCARRTARPARGASRRPWPPPSGRRCRGRAGARCRAAARRRRRRGRARGAAARSPACRRAGPRRDGRPGRPACPPRAGGRPRARRASGMSSGRGRRRHGRGHAPR